MSINLSTERVLGLSEAAQLLPGQPHTSSLWRWASRGRNGHRLETLLIGGRRYTSVEALQRFADALTAQADSFLSTDHSLKRMDRAVRAAEEALDKAGIR